MQNNPEQTNGFYSHEAGISELLRPLWHRRWKIIFFSLFVTLISIVYVKQLRPSYKATAILQIGSNKPNSTLSINDAFEENNASQEQVYTQYELLRSRKFAERVIARLRLTKNENFISGKYKENVNFLSKKVPSQISIDAAIERFSSALTISPVKNTELVKISFASYDPQLSMRVANQVGETYLEYQDELHRASKDTTSLWLIDQLEELGRKLESSEQALQTYREEEGLVDINGVVGLVGSELKSLTSSSLMAVKHKDDLYVTYQYIKENKDNIQLLSELNEVTSHPTYIQRKRSEEQISRRLFELKKRYGPKHPKRIAVEAELESIELQIDDQVKDIVHSLEKEYLASVAIIEANNNRLEKAKANFLRLSRLQNKFFQLEREVKTNQELYNNYLVRLKETDAMGNYKSLFYIRFIDKAVVPKRPFAPRKSIIVILAFVISFMVISITILMKELLKDTLNSNRKLENFSEANILAVLPFSKKLKHGGSGRGGSTRSDSRFIEAIRTLRTSLLFNQEKEPPKVIAVTSSVPNEGKSTIALELAKSFAEMEKVLLIEADMRNPTLYKSLNLDMHRPGLSNLLAKTHQINECIVREKDIKLDVLTSGISPANPLAFLSMKRFNMLTKVFGNFYDRIIIESPPVNTVSDGVIVSRLVDSVIYIVHGEKTPREQILSGLRMLKHAKAPIAGLVINHSENIDTARYHSRYYENNENIVKLPISRRG